MADANNQGGAVIVDNGESEVELWRQKCTRLEAHISTLKEVARLRQNLLDLRDKEIKDLILRLKIFEAAISKEKESRFDLNDRVEAAEKACTELTVKLRENIDKFNVAKVSYEEKMNHLARELEKCDRDLHKRTDELNVSELKNIELTSRLEDYNKLILENDEVVKKMKAEMQVISERNRVFSYNMNMLNTLFTEIEGTPIDFERIRAIGDIVRESQNVPLPFETLSALPAAVESAAAPDPNSNSIERRSSLDFSSLLDHMDVDKFTGDIPGEESCYKKVVTVDGPKLVLSVSQTFIKLKDLIVEKKHLQREIESLKNLNSKLESKVDRQERRLYVVTTELNRTWNLVAKLKMQHSKLHNSEAVLRYELQEKRKLLEKLKTELSRSRQQYVTVRQKHDESEELCQIMRAEFARRRQASSQDSGAVSAASSSPCSSPSAHAEDEEEDEIEESTVEANENMIDVSAIDNEEGLEDDDDDDEENDVDPIDELVDDLVQEIEAVTSAQAAESSSGNGDTDTDATSSEDRAFRTSRANRLRQLEDASRVLYSQLMATTVHGSALASRLAQLHDHYGSHDGTAPVTQAFQLVVDDGMAVDTEVVVTATDAVQYISPSDSMVEEDVATTVVVVVAEESRFEPLTSSPYLESPLFVSDGLEDGRLVNAEIVSSLSQSSEHLPVLAMTHAEALIMDIDSPQILAELAFTTIETRSPIILQATTTQIFDVGINPEQTPNNDNANDSDEELSSHDDAQEDREEDVSSSPDLSRLIIQQVPKRLERLKSENEAMKGREQELLDQVDEQRMRIESLETENQAIAERLQQEISSKDIIISSLRQEITNLVSRMNGEKETLATFMKSYLEEKSEIEASQSPSSTSNCHRCAKKFSLLRRRKHTCRICKKFFCQDCTTPEPTSSRGERRSKICSQCHDRQALLKSAAQSFL